MKGFTLTEVLVSIVIFLLVMGAIYAGYSLSQRAYLAGEVSAELTQNSRVILERMTRELRQSREIVTDLPVSMADAFNYIEFEDGHYPERYHYILYFQDGNEIKRELKSYYFSGDESVLVPWNAIPPSGEYLGEKIIEPARIIGEFAGDLKLWAPEIRKLNIFIRMDKNDKQIDLSTSVFGRNL